MTVHAAAGAGGVGVAPVAVEVVAAGRPWASPTTRWASRRTTECVPCGPVHESAMRTRLVIVIVCVFVSDIDSGNSRQSMSR